MIAAMLSTVAIGDLAAAARTIAAEPGLWFQLYIQPDLGFTEAIVRRAEDAGCRALVITSDSPVLGRNERNDRNDFHDLPAGLRCENLRELRGGEPGSVRQVSLSPQISWSHLDWLRQTSDLPILVKGILHHEDAKPRSTVVSMRSSSPTTVGDSSTLRRPPSTNCRGSSRPSTDRFPCCSTVASGAGPTLSRRSRSGRTLSRSDVRLFGDLRRRASAVWSACCRCCATSSRTRSPCAVPPRPGT